MIIYSFRLYVSGVTERSDAARVNLRRMCESRLRDRHEIEIIDTGERPDLAESDGILATPTVLRIAPPPLRRVVGDLSNHQRAAAALGLSDLDPSNADLSNVGQGHSEGESDD